jgi:Holliday junction DNA helicase RuvA
MLAYLRGTIQFKQLTGGAVDRLVLEVAGVGFELQVSHRTFLSLGQAGDSVTVNTALIIRENEWTIFGFSSVDEREMFNLVQSVSGIGPKLALALVGTLAPQELADAILSEDYKLISQAPGVGAKVAQRLVLELKAKIEDWKLRKGISIAPPGKGRSAAFEEVREILAGLGYTLTEINMVLKKAEDERVEDDVEVLVKHSLKVLGTVPS